MSSMPIHSSLPTALVVIQRNRPGLILHPSGRSPVVMAWVAPPTVAWVVLSGRDKVKSHCSTILQGELLGLWGRSSGHGPW
jgi:hypothetical protein